MIVSIILGFIFGIWIGSIFSIDSSFLIFLSVITSIFFFYRNHAGLENKQKILICFIFMLGMSLGVGRILISDLYKHSDLSQFLDKKVSAVGTIVSEPDVREENTKLTVKLNEIYYENSTTTVSEKILITVPMYPEYKYGDKVSLSITLEEPVEIESDNGHVFDYIGYLRVRGIWYTSKFTNIKLLSHGNGSIVKTALFKTKNAFTQAINNALPTPESSLLAGLLLGTKQSLGTKLLQEFQETGVSHIVVLSGYNIAIVAESIIDLFKFLPKTFSFGAGVIGIVLFTILSGGGASAWRAAIMVLVALFAKHTNRDYKASRVLGFTIVLMLAPNPLFLAFDPSFQLSILATIGLIYVTPIISPYLKKVTEKFGLREIIASTISTQIMVLPFLIYNTGVISLVSLPVNILILSTIPLTMLLGFITGILSFISLYLSFIPSLVTYSFLWYDLKIVHLATLVPMGYIELPAFSPAVLVLIYLVVISFLFYLQKRNCRAS